MGATSAGFWPLQGGVHGGGGGGGGGSVLAPSQEVICQGKMTSVPVAAKTG